MIKVRIDRLYHKNSVGIWIFDYDFGNKIYKVCKPVHMEQEIAPENYMLPDPTFDIPNDQAMELLKALLDALNEKEWFEDRRAKRDKEIVAVKEHLADMRKMADKLFALVDTKL